MLFICNTNILLDGDNFDEVEKYRNKQSKSGFFVEEFLRAF